MKILLAGPGTGKTRKIKSIITGAEEASKVLVLSFTNATVDDLQKKLSKTGITNDNCMTLHKFSVKYNHDKSRHILVTLEEKELDKISKRINVDFEFLCNFLNCTTFDQMIGRFVIYAETNPEYLKEKLSGFDTLVVDEYQDFNPNEQRLIDILIDNIKNSYILGDDDQCIYDFKDASSEKIISFYNDKTNEIIEHEHKCYRCPDKIIEHATYLIQNNKKRIDKKWEKTGKVGELIYKQFSTSADVADFTIGELKIILNSSPEETVLILSPVAFATEEIVQKLNEEKIEYTNCFKNIIPDDLVVKTWELKYLFGENKYLNLVLLGYKLLAVRKKFYEVLGRHCEKGQNMVELLSVLKSKLPAETIEKHNSIDEAIEKSRFEDIKDLYVQAEGHTENEKLENMLRPEEIEEKNIKVMSIHKSKGLDADHVFMVGLVEGIIPNKTQGSDSIEAQRRRFYVGMTRAKNNLYLISNIKIEGKNARRVNLKDFVFDKYKRVWNGKASSYIAELKLPQL